MVGTNIWLSRKLCEFMEKIRIFLHDLGSFHSFMGKAGKIQEFKQILHTTCGSAEY